MSNPPNKPRVSKLQICNQSCIDESIRVCRESRKTVQDAVTHLFAFVGTAIQNPELDSIALPYFGKFVSFKRKFQLHAKPVRLQSANRDDIHEPAVDLDGSGIQGDPGQE
jgi:hypothetical protein